MLNLTNVFKSLVTTFGSTKGTSAHSDKELLTELTTPASPMVSSRFLEFLNRYSDHSELSDAPQLAGAFSKTNMSKADRALALAILDLYVPPKDDHLAATLVEKYRDLFSPLVVLLGCGTQLSPKAREAICCLDYRSFRELPDLDTTWQNFLEREEECGPGLASVIHLSWITEQCCRKPCTYNLAEILDNHTVYAAIHDQLGWLTIGVMLDGIKAAHTVLANIEYYRSISDLVTKAGTSISAAAKDVRRGEINAKSAAMEGGSVSALASNAIMVEGALTLFSFPHGLTRDSESTEALQRLIGRFQGRSYQCYSAVKDAPDLSQAVDSCIRIDRHLSGNASWLFDHYGRDSLSEYRNISPFLQGLSHRLNLVGLGGSVNDVAVACLHNEFSSEMLEFLLKRISRQDDARAVKSVVRALVNLTERATTDTFALSNLSRLMDICPVLVDSFVTAVPPYLQFTSEKDLGFLESVYRENIYSGKELLKVLPQDEYRANPESFLDFQRSWGDAFWGLLVAYRKGDSRGVQNFLNEHRGAALKIKSLAGVGAGMLFSLLPVDQWETLGVKSARLFHEGAGLVIRRTMDRCTGKQEGICHLSWLLNTSEFKENFYPNRQHFGISHLQRYLAREVAMGEISSLRDRKRLFEPLVENLRCIEPRYKKDKRLAVLVSAKFDPNGAFDRHILKQAQQLRKLGYKVVCAEASTGEEALSIIRKVADMHRSVGGRVSRGVEFVGLHAHASPELLVWGDPSYSGDAAILDQRLDEQLCLKESLSGPDAIILVSGCGTGFGGIKKPNIARTMSQWNRGATVYGMKGYYGPDRFIVNDETGRIVGLRGRISRELGPDASTVTKFFS